MSLWWTNHLVCQPRGKASGAGTLVQKENRVLAVYSWLSSVCVSIKQLLKWINGFLETHPWSVCTVEILHLADSVHSGLQSPLLGILGQVRSLPWQPPLLAQGALLVQSCSQPLAGVVVVHCCSQK